MTSQQVATRFGATRFRHGWRGNCPVCHDHSLYINAATDGRVLAHCSRGCRIDEILAARQMTRAHLRPKPNPPPKPTWLQVIVKFVLEMFVRLRDYIRGLRCC